jgi:hypothetical protein
VIRKILVFGGRDFDQITRFGNRMDALHARFSFTHVIHGACNLKKMTGADWMADEWAKANGVQPVACEALWEFHRRRGNFRSAGPIRNDAMLGLLPEFALKCPGGTGTDDMLRRFKVYMALSRSVSLFDLDDPL